MGFSTSVYPGQKFLFIDVFNLLSTCPSILNIEESLREEVVFALSILETMDLGILGKVWWQAGSREQGAGSREPGAGSREQGMGTVVAQVQWRPQACVLSSPLQEPDHGRLEPAA